MDIGEQERVIMVEPIPVELPHEKRAEPAPDLVPDPPAAPEPTRFTQRSSSF